MDNTEYLRQARAAGRLYGGKLGDKLAYQVSQACASRDIAKATLLAARQAATNAISARPTAPFVETDAAAAWREAAAAVVFERIEPASNLTLVGSETHFPNRRDVAPAAADFDVSVA